MLAGRLSLLGRLQAMFSRHLDICNWCGGGIIFNAIATLLRYICSRVIGSIFLLTLCLEADTDIFDVSGKYPSIRLISPSIRIFVLGLSSLEYYRPRQRTVLFICWFVGMTWNEGSRKVPDGRSEPFWVWTGITYGL